MPSETTDRARLSPTHNIDAAIHGKQLSNNAYGFRGGLSSTDAASLLITSSR